MNTLSLSLFILAYLHSSIGQQRTLPSEWTAEDFPNPQMDYSLCGRYEKSYVCDPNGLLNTKEADTLDWLLRGIVNGTKCPCSANKCESKKSGYVIAVALVNKLKIPKTSSGKVENNDKISAIRKFAYDLENYKWKLGDCNEDVIIAYSADDKVLFTIAGGTVTGRLSQPIISDITKHRQHYFIDNKHVYAGLRSLIMDYREALMEGGFVYSQQIDQTPKGTGAHILSSVISILTLCFFTFLLQ